MIDPIATILVMVAVFGVSLWAFENESIERKYIFRPDSVLAEKEYYRLVSCSFLHAGWAHLLLNMYALYHFGAVIEWQFGKLHFLLIYFGSVMGGSLLSLYLHRHHEYSAYGASGGVCGLIFAYVLSFPNHRLTLFPLPYAVPAWLFAIAFAIASFYAMKAQKDNIGHDAHLGGAMIGLLIAAGLQPQLIQQHWLTFASLFLIGGVIFAYVYFNPMFLPLSGMVRVPTITLKRGRSRRPQPAPVIDRQPRKTATRYQPPPPKPAHDDWLIEEIEIQVGTLKKDDSGPHQWIDKFGRTYDVVGGAAETFDIQTFRAVVLERLNNPSVNFVIVDTRQLKDGQVALVRPFIADLPDAQFNRVLRSYAFKPRA